VANRLSNETSPYLLQHANNPVDWYAWGDEALARARAEDRPVLLSIGYSACHWCHVMEHESFENPETAALMNANFINIKVDREERPDLDAIYMQAVQAITGSGGWPMTVFLTPDGTPFYGGTYFPPQDRGTMPGFPRVLTSVADAYRNRRGDIERSGRDLLQHLQRSEERQAAGVSPTPGLLAEAFAALSKGFDGSRGGFGGAPKFPQPMALDFLLRHHYRTGEPQAFAMVEFSLRQMAAGGIYDHLGGGFHRYSTDAQWLVPHFEKMLYDNAQLSRVYLNAYQVTGSTFYRRIVEETLDYVIREMTSPEGGFFSTQDADSEGEEGKFFVWSTDEIVDLLGPDDGLLFCAFFDVSRGGNFEGKNILHAPRGEAEVAGAAGVSEERLRGALERGRALLFRQRSTRVAPGLDDKIVVSWNGLMQRAFAEASRVLERDDYLQAATRNAEFIRDRLWRAGRLQRTYRAGQAKGQGYLEDYACLTNALLSLYEATFDSRWFAWARELAATMLSQFADDDGAGFFDTGTGHEALVLRPQDLFDNAMPSGNSAAAEALLRLASFTGDSLLEEKGLSVFRLVMPALARYPTAFGNLLSVAEFAIGPRKEVAIVGPPNEAQTRDLIRTVFRLYLPSNVVAGSAPDDESSAAIVPLLDGRVAANGQALAYVCEHFTCQMPISDASELASRLLTAST
jgi:uncharacterized protein YyaL (SSP411 family)